MILDSRSCSVHCVSSPQMWCFVFYGKFCLPMGLHSSCSIRPTAGGTSQKSWTISHDRGDGTDCTDSDGEMLIFFCIKRYQRLLKEWSKIDDNLPASSSLHGAHPADSPAPDEDAPRGDVGEPLDDDDDLVSKLYCPLVSHAATAAYEKGVTAMPCDTLQDQTVQTSSF